MACKEEPLEEKPVTGISQNFGLGAAQAKMKAEPLEEKPVTGISQNFGLGSTQALEAQNKRSGKSNWAAFNAKRKAEHIVALKLPERQPVKRLFGKQPLPPARRRVIQSAVRIEVHRKVVSRGTQTDIY